MSNRESTVIVKYGSPSVTNELGMDGECVDNYAAQISRLSERYRVIVVSSGSIVTGQALWAGKHTLPDEDYAALGSAQSFMAWNKALLNYGMYAAQVPVTDHEISSSEGVVLKKRLASLLGNGIIPVANGNDVLSGVGAQDIRIDRDNDRLAGHLRELTEAQQLLLLTNKDGLLDTQGNVVKYVYPDTAGAALSLVVGGGEGERGGMSSKAQVAIEAMHQGAVAHIARAGADLQAVIDEQVGTHFIPT